MARTVEDQLDVLAKAERGAGIGSYIDRGRGSAVVAKVALKQTKMKGLIWLVEMRIKTAFATDDRGPHTVGQKRTYIELLDPKYDEYDQAPGRVKDFVMTLFGVETISDTEYKETLNEMRGKEQLATGMQVGFDVTTKQTVKKQKTIHVPVWATLENDAKTVAANRKWLAEIVAGEPESSEEEAA